MSENPLHSSDKLLLHSSAANSTIIQRHPAQHHRDTSFGSDDMHIDTEVFDDSSLTEDTASMDISPASAERLPRFQVPHMADSLRRPSLLNAFQSTAVTADIDDTEDDEDDNHSVIAAIYAVPTFPLVLDPTRPPPITGKTNLYQLLLAIRLPEPRPYYSTKTDGGKTVLASTRQSKPTARRPRGYLRLVIYAPSMLDTLEEEGRTDLEEIDFDFANPQHRDWVARVLPFYAAALLAQVIHSESDIEPYVFMIVRIVLVFVLAVQNGGIPDLVQSESEALPYISSAVQDQKPGITDMELHCGRVKYPAQDIRLLGEVKSTNVLHPCSGLPEGITAQASAHDLDDRAEGYRDVEDEDRDEISNADDEPEDVTKEDNGEDTDNRSRRVEPDEHVTIGFASAHISDDSSSAATNSENDQSATGLRHILSELQVTNQQYPEGSASKFYWPNGADSSNKSAPNSFRRIQTKVLMQLWEQVLRRYKPRGGLPLVRSLLSSYDVTTFVVGKGTTMYISRNYEYDSPDLLMGAYGVVAHALKVAKKDFKLPVPINDWEGVKLQNPDGPGIVRATIPR